MTLTVAALSGAGDSAGRHRFVDRFVQAGSDLRGRADASPAASPAYARLVLSLAAERRSELLLALEGDTIVARALIAESPAHAGAAALGLFEANLDAIGRAGGMIVGAAVEWARTNGRSEIFAPLDVNTWLSYRFLVRSDPLQGPDLYSWEPAHPREYCDLFERHGFDEAERYHTIGLQPKGGAGLSAGIRQIAPARASGERAGYRFQQLGSPDDMAAVMDELHPLCMDAFRDNFLFEPISLELFRRLQSAVAAGRDCSLSHVVRDAGGALVGFVFVFIDRGDVVIKTIAVRPDARSRHVSTALIHAVLQAAAARGCKSIVSALVRQGNTSEFLSQRHMHDDVSTWRREYVLLRKRIGS